MNQEDEADRVVWCMFAAAYLSGDPTVGWHAVAQEADDMLKQFRIRFPRKVSEQNQPPLNPLSPIERYPADERKFNPLSVDGPVNRMARNKVPDQ